MKKKEIYSELIISIQAQLNWKVEYYQSLYDPTLKECTGFSASERLEMAISERDNFEVHWMHELNEKGKMNYDFLKVCVGEYGLIKAFKHAINDNIDSFYKMLDCEIFHTKYARIAFNLFKELKQIQPGKWDHIAIHIFAPRR